MYRDIDLHIFFVFAVTQQVSGLHDTWVYVSCGCFLFYFSRLFRTTLYNLHAASVRNAAGE